MFLKYAFKMYIRTGWAESNYFSCFTVGIENWN